MVKKIILMLGIIGLVSVANNADVKAYNLEYPSAYGWWRTDNGYDCNNVTGKTVSGDFDGDGKDDVATMYNYGGIEARIHVFLSTGSSFSYTDCNGWWNSGGYYDANKVTGRMVAGDFNGDGKDDIAAMYDYGSGQSRMHVFLSTGSSFSYPSAYGWWSVENGYDANRVTGRMVAGDFDGDGKDDIAAMYDYGSGQSRIHVFKSTGSSFSYTDCNGWWSVDGGYDANRVTDRMVAGDFNGDGKDDIATMYDYGSGQSRMHVFLSTGSSFNYPSAYGWWSVESGYDANRVTGRMVAGDFDGNGKDDIATMYDYNNESRIHAFISTGSGFSYTDCNGWWNSEGYYDANKVTGRMVAGNFNGTGACDIAAMYDYGNSASTMHVFLSKVNAGKGDAEKFINVARGELGYVEGRNNWTKYGAWYGMQNQPWCAMFVSWCASNAGISSDVIPRHSLCSDGARWFMNRGLWHKSSNAYIPKQGDIIYFYVDGGINHVGIVESTGNGYVNTIEGNTSDKVARRSYAIGYSGIAGYGSPNFVR